MVSYKPLWKLLIDKDMNKKELAEKCGLSTSSLTKLTHSESVTTNMLCKICKVLDCDFKDIMTYIPDGEEDNK